MTVRSRLLLLLWLHILLFMEFFSRPSCHSCTNSTYFNQYLCFHLSKRQVGNRYLLLLLTISFPLYVLQSEQVLACRSKFQFIHFLSSSLSIIVLPIKEAIY